jgi:hypothetical protein
MTGQPGAAVVRFLVPADVETLIALEERTWTAEQSTSGAEMARRIEAYPRLSVGAFSPSTGQALASLFMKPITLEEMRAANTWLDCAGVDCTWVDGAVPAKTRALFGISLSSVDAAAVDGLLGFFWPHALKAGWRDIYLGSPVPGLRSWLQANPEAPVDEYVRDRRNGRPRDPQLRYYYRKGFRHIVAWKPDYFPHEASLDHGVVLRGRIPLSGAAPLWRVVPLSWLQRMRSVLFLALRATAS